MTPAGSGRGIQTIRIVLGLDPAGSATEHRHVGIARGALSALGVRGLGIVTSLVTVPLTVGYLGPERYGALMTMYSFLAWVAIADLGLGNELTNAIASAHGRQDETGARRAIASVFWLLCALATVLLAAGGLAWSLLDWVAIFNVRSAEAVAEVGPAMGLAFALFCMAFPLSVVDRVLISFQRGGTANAWAAVGSITALASVLAATRARGGLVLLVAATAGTNLLVKAISAVWLFWVHRPSLRPVWRPEDRAISVHLLRRGGMFFLVQVASLVLYSTDNIIIARVLGADRVTPYSVTWNLFALTQVFTNAAFPYLWAAYGEALGRGDTIWMGRTLRRSLVLGTALTVTLVLPLTLFGAGVIRWWIGPEAVPDASLLWWMAAWNVILAPAQAVAAFLNANGKTGVQASSGLVTAVANIGLSVVLAHRYGTSGVIAATVLSYALLAAVPATVAMLRTLASLGAYRGGGTV